MATKKFYIIDSPEEQSDGVIQTRDKENIGFAHNQDAPVGSFINCSLQDHWIITDEEYQLLKEVNKK